jgi:hypothetical protein
MSVVHGSSSDTNSELEVTLILIRGCTVGAQAVLGKRHSPIYWL